jgi:galactokinase
MNQQGPERRAKLVPRTSATWAAPGRVNLIGEHTDYNLGFALPFAIEQSCTATVTVVDGTGLVIRSAQREDTVTLAEDDVRPGADLDWAGYVAGVVWAVRRDGARVPGLDIHVDSTVPVGAGLSSSAALACSVALAVQDVLGLGLDRDALLALTRSVENDFVGAPTGGLDQLAALRCVPGHALFCDLRSLQTRQVELDVTGHRLAILVIDTRAHHAHASGEYRERRDGCERAAALLGLTSLRELDMAGLASALERLPGDELRRYTRHVVTENERVLRTVELLDAGEPESIGPLLTASHASLRDDYRITVPELDVAVEVALRTGALGARMTGGGFGGSVIALLPAELVPACERAVAEAFAAHGFLEPRTFVTAAAGGAREVVPG